MLAIIEKMPEYKKHRIISLVTIALTIFILASYSMGLLAFISPSQELRWNTEFQGINPTYSQGATVNLVGELEEGTQFIQNGEYFVFTSPESIRWAITIKDPNNMPVHFVTGILTDIQGDQQLSQIDFIIPVNAETGIYTVKLIAWNDLLPTGNTRTHEIMETNFEVTSP